MKSGAAIAAIIPDFTDSMRFHNRGVSRCNGAKGGKEGSVDFPCAWCLNSAQPLPSHVGERLRRHAPELSTDPFFALPTQNLAELNRGGYGFVSFTVRIKYRETFGLFPVFS